MKEIRWRQRFENFKRSFTLLQEAAAIKQLSEIEKAGLIQYFEVAFELAWKTLKDFEECEGFIVKSPRDAIKLAVQNEYITEGVSWLEMLSDRNSTTHLYDEKMTLEIVEKISSTYVQRLAELNKFLDDQA
jgi:nucleotidyltransferase substrate binding protein (TIGR01987 family)